LSQPGPVSAAWVSSSGRQLFVARLADGGGNPERFVLQASRRARFLQPSIQTLDGGDVAVAWSTGAGPAARVEVGILRPLSNGTLRVLSRLRTGRGEYEPDLSLTSDKRLLLATTRSKDGIAIRSLDPQRLGDETPLVITGNSPTDPQLTSFSAGGLSGGLLYRTGQGIRLALLGERGSRPQLRLDQAISGDGSDKGPAVSSDGKGLVAMSWAERNKTQPGYDVMVRSYFVKSNRLGPTRRAHLDTTAEQRDPMLTVQTGGLVRTVWRDLDDGGQGLATSLHRITNSGDWQRLDERSYGGKGFDPDVSWSQRGDFYSWTSGGSDGGKINLIVDNGKIGNRSKGNTQSEDQPELNEVVATLKKDRLQATKASDVFIFPTRRHSLADRYDVITGYQSGDLIDDHHARRNIKVNPITASAGRINNLTSKQLDLVCKDSNGYGVYGAVAFTVKDEPGVWLAINDKRPGFQDETDPIIHMKDFSFSTRGPITII